MTLAFADETLACPTVLVVSYSLRTLFDPCFLRRCSGPPIAAILFAGDVANTRENLVAFIVDPRIIEPNTAVPDLAVNPSEALK
jgi:hypothetical protein